MLRSKTEEITGYPQHEAEGQLFVERFVQKLQSSVTEVFDKALRGIQTSNYSLELHTKGGDTRYLLVNATTRRGEDGEITGVLGVAQDVTDAKIVEKQVCQKCLSPAPLFISYLMTERAATLSPPPLPFILYA